MTPRPVQLDLPPHAVLARWPDDWTLASLWSGDPDSSRSRWTILARPSSATGAVPTPGPAGAGSLLPPHRTPAQPAPVPFPGGWIGFISYDAGRVLEPRAAHGPARASGWPIAHWARCDEALLYDHAEQHWWETGRGDLAGAVCANGVPATARSFTLGPLASRTGRARYIRDAARTLEYIRAGDIYQANLAHALAGRFSGSARMLFADLAARARPWYGAYLELPGRALLSFSPELFLSLDPTSRLVETRPMKGTRPASTDPRELELAHKDRAELNMIIDLQRNDLGRVCDFGTVRVEQPREIERHGRSLLQATATVTGRLRAGLGPADLIAATFPGGSITGAPKIRAMQIIDELEPQPRGPYCGAIGWLGDDGRLSLNIAIRTALVTADHDQDSRNRQGGGTGFQPVSSRGGPGVPPGYFDSATLSYSVGAGIVADSDPEAEWRETLDKASIWTGLTTVEG